MFSSRSSSSNPSVTLIASSYTVLSECRTYPFSVLVVSEDLVALACCTAVYVLKFQLHVYEHNSEYLIKPCHVQITNNNVNGLGIHLVYSRALNVTYLKQGARQNIRYACWLRVMQ